MRLFVSVIFAAGCLAAEPETIALAHDLDGERILAACGADLPQLRKDLDKYLNESVEQFSRGQQKEPEQTLALRRVLQTAVLLVQSAGRQEVQSGDVLAATLQQNKSYAAQLLAAQGVTRLDVLEYITHGISKVPSPSCLMTWSSVSLSLPMSRTEVTPAAMCRPPSQ
jgi:ATP-dependent Clp protease ATP-binding subunit ClpA